MVRAISVAQSFSAVRRVSEPASSPSRPCCAGCERWLGRERQRGLVAGEPDGPRHACPSPATRSPAAWRQALALAVSSAGALLMLVLAGPRPSRLVGAAGPAGLGLVLAGALALPAPPSPGPQRVLDISLLDVGRARPTGAVAGRVRGGRGAGRGGRDADPADQPALAEPGRAVRGPATSRSTCGGPRTPGWTRPADSGRIPATPMCGKRPYETQ